MRGIYQKARFTLAAASDKQFPLDEGYEVAFAGRSNAGKSSVINVITSQKSLARTSKTPGRTQQIIFFDLDEQRRFVDFPGYGYAKVGVSVKDQWRKLIQNYFDKRRCLRGLILVMDIRHPLKDVDWQMLEWCMTTNTPVVVLLNKSDKLAHGAAKNSLLKIQAEIKEAGVGNFTIQLFSALKKTGAEQLLEQIDTWLEI
ncbi:MAG: ribosome biogenesis GTP-binding protein YihA/YsxC [Gammaproteobacteria bacterium]|nr:ribosome biogenesis GTP-binding protein YihA/YsxC [Gammaproteobacteria bacterium]MDH5728593.1 ribosome biogenesis GTP-binding protein YihA/YsxC [Gammaproteobacteria bacterium]